MTISQYGPEATTQGMAILDWVQKMNKTSLKLIDFEGFLNVCKRSSRTKLRPHIFLL